jgi:hypothetical protein
MQANLERQANFVFTQPKNKKAAAGSRGNSIKDRYKLILTNGQKYL